MIKVRLCDDYGHYGKPFEDVINDELAELQSKDCKIIDIKFVSNSVVTEDVQEGGQNINEGSYAMIIYSEVATEEDYKKSIR